LFDAEPVEEPACGVSPSARLNLTARRDACGSFARDANLECVAWLVFDASDVLFWCREVAPHIGTAAKTIDAAMGSNLIAIGDS
jgi:hypothetical protein